MCNGTTPVHPSAVINVKDCPEVMSIVISQVPIVSPDFLSFPPFHSQMSKVLPAINYFLVFIFLGPQES